MGKNPFPNIMELTNGTIYVISFVIATLAICYWYLSKKFQYWESRGIVGPKPTFLFGNMMIRIWKRPDEWELDWRRRFGKIYGTYMGFLPVLNICDLELVKQIMVKDFPIFVNRRTDMVYHELWNQNLVQLQGDKWKLVRSIVSPTFTSGKLRGMLPLMNRCIDKLVNYLDKQTTDSECEVNIKEVVTGFTMDVIASTSFALDTDCNGDRSRKSPFIDNAYQLFDFSFFKIMLALSLPKSISEDLLNVRLLFKNDQAFYYLVDLVKQILAQRSQQSLVNKRNDLVQLLMDASIDEKQLKNQSWDKLTASIDSSAQTENTSADSELGAENRTQNLSKRQKLTENEIIAQCILFLLAGYDTTSATISYLLYELALNPVTQQRLFTEINDALEEIDTNDHNSDQYYNAVLNRIPYLEAAIKETLRKYPPGPRLERRVGIGGYRLGSVELEKDQLIEIPVYVIHHSEEYYPDPERFDPDRFMPENRHLLVPYSYLPFGTGPRNCVGMRFAYQEMKLVLVQLITRYRFETIPDRTPIPLLFKKSTPMMTVDSIPIKISRRAITDL